MTILISLLLGLIQGLCEFFPVSSSAHLHLFQTFFNYSPDIFFDLTVHLGSLLAVVLILRKTIIQEYVSNFFLYFFGLLPLIPIYLAYKLFLKNFISMQYIGLFFLLTSLMLFMLYVQNKRPSPSSNKWKDVLFIGAMQGLALFPGISRSGSTIWAAKKRNWPVEKAIRFSFLLAIPATVGGSFLESFFHMHHVSSFFSERWPSYLTGFSSSFAVSLVCAKIIFSFKSYKQFLPFAWYCLIIGIAVLIYMNLFA